MLDKCEIYEFFKKRHYTTISKLIAEGHLLPIILRSNNRIDLEVARLAEDISPEKFALGVCSVVYAFEHGALQACVEGCHLFNDVAVTIPPGHTSLANLANTITVSLRGTNYMMAFARVISRFDTPWPQRIKGYMRKTPLDMPICDKFNLASSLIWVGTQMVYNPETKAIDTASTGEWLAIQSAYMGMVNIVNANLQTKKKKSPTS